MKDAPLGAEDYIMEAAVRATRPSAAVCSGEDSILCAIESCLDSDGGDCIVVDSKNQPLGRLTLEEIRSAILDGSILGAASVAAFLRQRAAAEKAAPGTQVRASAKQRPVQIAAPDLSHREFRFVLDAFLSFWISGKGAYVEQFEAGFAASIGMGHGVAVMNGTAALHLALVALGVGPGDDVIVPDLTFAATINAVLYCGARPVIVDVDPRSWSMTAAAVAPAITDRTACIVPVHLYGRPAEIGPIAELARARGIRVVEDCAEAQGARYAGRPVGQFSDIACFSFHANKLLSTGEGGMCVTDDAALSTRMRELRDHGMVAGQFYWHERVGYNYRMPNMQAAIGLAQLPRVGETIDHHRRLEDLYRKHLRDVPRVGFPPPLTDEGEAVVWLVAVLVPPEARDKLIAAAAQQRIELRPFFHPLSAMPPYQDYARHCSTSILLSRSGLNLPTSRAVDEAVVEQVADIFRRVLG